MEIKTVTNPYLTPENHRKQIEIVHYRSEIKLILMGQ